MSPLPNPEMALSGLMDYIKPSPAAQSAVRAMGEAWEPPTFENYEDIRTWMSESVMSATLFERFPDGRWTIQLMLKEQKPGPYRYIVL